MDLVPFKLLREGAQSPVRQHADDAGADLAVCLEGRTFVDLGPGETRLLPTGVAVQLPAGHAGRIASRSSMRKRGIACDGVIDAGYRGELQLITTNTTRETIRVKHGEKIAQLIVHPVANAWFVRVDELAPSERGTGGFGSTDAPVRVPGSGG